MKNQLLTLLFVLITLKVLSQSANQEVLSNNATIVHIKNDGRILSNSNSDFGAFEAPRSIGSDTHSSTIFTAGLWLGALDADSNIHLAAMTYKQRGRDFWPGPVLDNLDSNTQTKYDKIYKVSKAQIEDHKRNSSNPIRVILDWPGNGDTTIGEPWHIAPFVDLNQNGVYEPRQGEYPRIKGLVAAYCVYNDAGLHTNTQGEPLNVEVHQLYYQDDLSLYGENMDDINLASFTIINKSPNTYTNFRFGIFTDYDLGNWADDYIGCDPSIDLSFVYNGDDTDEGIHGFGETPPAQGLAFLNHRMGSHVVNSNTGNTINGNPQIASDYYNYLNAKWRTGTPITYGGNGILYSKSKANFMYPFYKDPYHPDDNWN